MQVLNWLKLVFVIDLSLAMGAVDQFIKWLLAVAPLLAG